MCRHRDAPTSGLGGGPGETGRVVATTEGIKRSVVGALESQLQPEWFGRGDLGQRIPARPIQAIGPGGDNDPGHIKTGQGFFEQRAQPFRLTVGGGVGLEVGQRPGSGPSCGRGPYPQAGQSLGQLAAHAQAGLAPTRARGRTPRAACTSLAAVAVGAAQSCLQPDLRATDTPKRCWSQGPSKFTRDLRIVPSMSTPARRQTEDGPPRAT